MNIDILAFAAHPDDVEISCGGTLIKYQQMGKKIGIVDLTQGELGTRGSSEKRREEAANASVSLGLSVRKNLELKDGFFANDEASMLKIITEIRRFRPEIVLANSLEDRHPDHGKAAKLVADACFLAGLSKIETMDNNEIQAHYRPRLLLHYIQDYYIEPDIVLDVSPFYDQKIEAIKCYSSQFFDPNSTELGTPISGEDFFEFLKGRMMTLGRPIGAKYAEGFSKSRLLGVDDLFELR